MYKIIGGDGQEYGPVDANTIRQWVAQGRISTQTRIREESSTDWKLLGDLPEFAGAAPATAVAPASPAPGFGAAAASAGPPAAALSGDATRERALSLVKGPAIALIVVAALGIAYYLFSGVTSFLTGGAMFQQGMSGNVPPEVARILQNMRGPVAGLVSLLVVGFWVVVLLGALKMMKLRSYGLAMAAAIMAMIPCNCCCLLGLPFGIWALVMLMKPEVKSQFS